MIIRWKIDKAEDSLRRRMRLKRDYQASFKEYLSVSAFQEKQKRERKMSNQSTTNTALDASSDSGHTSLYHDDLAPTPTSKSESKQPLVLADFLIPKEEVLSEYKEKMNERRRVIRKWKKECEKIALKGAIYGDIEITESAFVIFTPSAAERPDDPPYRFGALKNTFIKNSLKRKQWSVMNIAEVHVRNYNLMPTAVEIFIKDDGKTYFFNLYKEEYQLQFIKKIKEINPNVIAITDRAKDFQKLDYQTKWVEGQISNFDYLMILNTYAGRSYNDINQYPVFPWIIQDWTSETIDVNTTDEEVQNRIFRKLDTPIGALNPKKREDAIEKFVNWHELLGDEPRFHYGSHYSNAGSVINFLIRIEPFTSLNIDLQSGRFDQADRLFSSIKSAWTSCYEHRSDFRELLPEFFYLPDFLRNT